MTTGMARVTYAVAQRRKAPEKFLPRWAPEVKKALEDARAKAKTLPGG